MKSTRILLLPAVVFAIVITSNFSRAQSPPVAANAPLPPPTPYAVTKRDANSRVWEWTTYERSPDGQIVVRTNSYTELATGLNFQKNGSGQWTESKEEIDILPQGGASATQGAHQIFFPADIASGVIQLTTPDGKQLRSRPASLFYVDDTNSAIIAFLTNSVGELVGSNQVVYPNAFEGAVASVRYTYSRAGFEQDIVVQGQLPDPAAFGLDPARTRLGVLTTFFDTNNPVVTPESADAADGLSDSTLTFGSMKIGRGRAFAIGNTAPSRPPGGVTPANWLNWLTNASQQASSKGTPTYKLWFQGNGRNYLMEEVPYRRVAAQLKQLPPATGRLDSIGTNLFAANSFLDAIPARLLSAVSTGQPGKTPAMRLSRVNWDKTPAVVLDYVTVNSGGDYTFQGDTTYYVSGPCYFNNITLEGGTVIKYANAYSADSRQIGTWDYATVYIEVDGSVTCQTSSYHPAVFTAIDDNTVGQSFGNGYPQGNYYANPAIYAPGGVSLSNVRISYAQQAVWVGDRSSITLSDSQVMESGVMAVLGWDDGYSYPVTLTCNNCLCSDASSAYAGVLVVHSDNGGDSYYLNNCTIDNIYYLAVGPNYNNNGIAANCIFANTENTGTATWENSSYNGFYNSYATFGSHQTPAYVNPFQAVNGGNYYLADDTFRGKGTTTGVSSGLLGDVKTKTTYPPNVSYINQSIPSGNLTADFTPQVSRDNENHPGPDLGYHYDPLDYVFQNIHVNSGITFAAGTAVGWQGQGLAFSAGYTVNFNGTAALPCYFVRCNTVQESSPSGDGTGIAGSGQSPSVNATFTRFSALGDLATFFDAQMYYATLNNCEVWNGQVGGVASGGLDRYFYFNNCLFDRTAVNATILSGGYLIDLRDCTLHGGSLTLVNNYNSDTSAYANDSAFDNTSIAVDASYMDFSHNAFLSVANSYLPNSSPLNDQNSDVFVSSFNWQPGQLGNFYLPANSPLIDAGDQYASGINVTVNGANAQAPLSDFTTQTSQTSDSGLVDIGYHYVATDVFNGPGAPQLTTTCLSDGIALTWTYTANPEFPIQDFVIYRSNSSGGYDNIATVSTNSHFYVDKTITANQTYCYLVTFDYYDPFTDTTYPTPLPAPNAPGYSNESCNHTCSLPTLPPDCTKTDGIDVVFIIDNTGSMINDGRSFALDAVKAGIVNALSDIVAASGTTPNYRLALITPDSDQVHVRVQFAPNNISDFETELAKLPDLSGYYQGNNIPESTDECLNTAANALPASGRTTNPTGCTLNDPDNKPPNPLQINDFLSNPAQKWRSNARKFIVIITDAPPGGFCDPFTFSPSEDGVRAIGYAVSAGTQCMRINAIQVYHPDQDPADTKNVMQAYASITSGWYSQLDDQADSVADAIRVMLYSSNPCGCP